MDPLIFSQSSVQQIHLNVGEQMHQSLTEEEEGCCPSVVWLIKKYYYDKQVSGLQMSEIIHP